jgi:four helix bundle protein
VGPACELQSAVGMPLRHHSLIAWQRADDLFVSLHKLAKESFPPDERYELGSQLRRAAYSVAANIVEGYAREHQKERLQFLNVSWGSLAEVGYCLHVARRLGYIDRKSYEGFELEVRRVGAPLSGLIERARITRE